MILSSATSVFPDGTARYKCRSNGVVGAGLDAGGRAFRTGGESLQHYHPVPSAPGGPTRGVTNSG